MRQDPHEKVRQLIACSGAEGLSEREQSTVHEHLRGCESCRMFADRARQMAQAMRATPVAASHSLVTATKQRLRERARELEERRQRMMMALMCFAVVEISSAVTLGLLWQGLDFVSDWLAWPTLTWAAAIGVFWIVPTIAMSLMFLAKGTYLSVGSAE